MCESAFICRGDDAPGTLSARPEPEPEAACACAACPRSRRRQGSVWDYAAAVAVVTGGMAELIGAPDEAARCA